MSCAGASLPAVVLVLGVTVAMAVPGAARRSVPGEAPVWVSIRPARFLMGCVPGDRRCDRNERPRHEVVLTRPYALTATEVTVGQYDAFSAATGGRTPRQPRWNAAPRHPVVNITWEEAAAVCGWLGGRLPTEAEWEYGARGGADGQVFPWEGAFERRRANAIGRRSDDDPWHYTAPVASFPPNGFGLYDTSGNVWEWTADWYSPRYPAGEARDPRGPGEGRRKVIRGGSWDSTAPRVRTSVRHSLPTGARYNLYVGVRCARDLR